MFLSPIDPLLAVLYTAYGLRPLRVLLLFVGLMPAALYALPAQPCGCIRVPFMRCSSTGRTSAYRVAMRSDLKNLASQQEIFFSDNGTYSSGHQDLAFVPSNGVHVTVHASAEGWAARATHEALPDSEACAMYYGSAPPNGIDDLEDAGPGEHVCTN